MTDTPLKDQPTHRLPKLGRRAPTPHKSALLLADFLIPGQIPAHPIAVDDFGGIAYGLDGNDRFGVCGPTSGDNAIRCITGLLTGAPRAMTQDMVFELYRWAGNPTFDPNADPDPVTGEVPGDNGVNLQTMLEAMLAHELILGFAKLDLADEEVVRAANYLFLALIVGVNLDKAQQAQTRAGKWDYVRGSGPWGGHAVMQGAYTASGEEEVISWAQPITMTPAFVDHQREEAWVILLPEHVKHPDFRTGFDLAGFAAAFSELTHKPWPGQLPDPTPDPTPSPSPYANSVADDQFAQALHPWLAHRHTGANHTVAVAAHDWLTTRGYDPAALPTEGDGPRHAQRA